MEGQVMSVLKSGRMGKNRSKKRLALLFAVAAGLSHSAYGTGRIWIADDFDAPLPDDLLKAFYGGALPKLTGKSRRKRK